MTKSIYESFSEHFEIVPAITDDSKRQTYQLRYTVYCLETGFEDAAQFPEGLEYDEFDARSAHFLIRHRKTGECVATTRLILPHTNDPSLPYLEFPIETHCMLTNVEILKNIPASQIAEVSRFCVSNRFKRRKGEMNTLFGFSEDSMKSHSLDVNEHRYAPPNFAVPLITCLVRMSIRHGITHWYALMEPSLARMIKSLGIVSIPIGPSTEYHGKRRPYVIKLADVLSGTKKKDPAAWDLLTNYGKFWEEDWKDKKTGGSDPKFGRAAEDAVALPPLASPSTPAA